VNADSLNCRLVGNYDYPTGFPIDVALADTCVYIAWAEGGLRIVSVADPHSPYELGVFAAATIAIDVAVQDSFVYVANHSNGIYVVNVADPRNPTEVGHVGTAGIAARVAVKDTLLYVADRNAGLRVFSVANPASPSEIGHCDTVGIVNDVAVAGDFAYLVSGMDNDIWVVNVADPSSPQPVGRCPLPNGGEAVAISGGYAYVAGSDLYVIDISNPASPTLTKSYATTGYCLGVTIAGSIAYVGDASYGLRVLNVSDPRDPQEVGYYNTPGMAGNATVAGEYIYLADDASGLQVIQFYGAGVAEKTVNDERGTLNVGPTIVRGVLNLPTSSFTLHHSLFSLSGRKVLDLRPGPNDVSFVWTYDHGENWIRTSSVCSWMIWDICFLDDTTQGWAVGTNGFIMATTPGLGGIEEAPSANERTSNRGATIVRNVLLLPPSSLRLHPSSLLDISGRKVLDIHPGANDVSRLAPGVYFLHSSIANRQSPMTKVIIAR